MITSIITGVLVASIIGVIGWAYKMSLTINTHASVISSSLSKIDKLEAEVKQNDLKYLEILKALMEIKVELQNKQNRRDAI